MINNEITAPVVRLVTEEGAHEIATTEALKMAREQELDLICISDSGRIPVVKIDDYNRYLYEKNKKKKDQEKKARLNSIDNKEIQLSTSIADHDLEIKASKMDKMLEKGARIRIVIRYRGREMARISEGPAKLTKLTDKITAKYKVEKMARIEGNQVSMIIASAK